MTKILLTISRHNYFIPKMNLKAIVGNHRAGNSLVSLPAGSHWWRPRGSHPIRVSQPVAWLVLAAKETTMIILIKIILCNCFGKFYHYHYQHQHHTRHHQHHLTFPKTRALEVNIPWKEILFRILSAN